MSQKAATRFRFVKSGFVYFGLVVILGVFSGQSWLRRRGLPRLDNLVRLSECEYGVGAKTRGDKVQHTFWIENVSHKDLQVQRATSNAQITVTPQRLPPEVRAQVTLSADTSRYKSNVLFVTGRVFFKGHNEPIVMSMRGTLVDLPTTPSITTAGEFHAGQAREVRYDVLPNSKVKLKLLNADYPRSQLDLRVTQAKDGLQVHVLTKPTIPPGDFRYEVRLHTNDIVQPVKTTIVAGRVLPDFELDRSYVSTGILQPGERFRCTLSLSSKTASNFSILSAECNLPGGSVRTRSTPALIQLIDFELVPARGPIDGKITVQTETSPVRVFSIPVYGLCLPPARPER